MLALDIAWRFILQEEDRAVFTFGIVGVAFFVATQAQHLALKSFYKNHSWNKWSYSYL